MFLHLLLCLFMVISLFHYCDEQDTMLAWKENINFIVEMKYDVKLSVFAD